MRIYIRHGQKLYRNGRAEKYKFDPGLTYKGQQQSIRTARHLVERFGPPDQIICSPYLRTRDTAKNMSKVLVKDCPISIDKNLSEYLGNHKQHDLDVTETTKSYNPPHPESFLELKDRVKHHNLEIMKQNIKHKIIWIVTHGLIIKELATLNNLKRPKHVRNLGYIYIPTHNNLKMPKHIRNIPTQRQNK